MFPRNHDCTKRPHPLFADMSDRQLAQCPMFQRASEGWKKDFLATNRRRRRSRWGFTAKALNQSLWHMGMYSSDPYLARIATVHTVQEQVGVQRQMQAAQRVEDQARHEQELAQARAEEEERMRTMARVMAQEMFAEAERRGSRS